MPVVGKATFFGAAAGRIPEAAQDKEAAAGGKNIYTYNNTEWNSRVIIQEHMWLKTIFSVRSQRIFTVNINSAASAVRLQMNHLHTHPPPLWPQPADAYVIDFLDRARD